MPRRELGSYGGNPTDWSLADGVHTLRIGPHKLEITVENDLYFGWINSDKVLESVTLKVAKRRMKDKVRTLSSVGRAANS